MSEDIRIKKTNLDFPYFYFWIYDLLRHLSRITKIQLSLNCLSFEQENKWFVDAVRILVDPY